MAAGTKLKLVFETPAGQKTWSFNYVKPNSTAAHIKSVATAMITHGSIYKYPPLSTVSAALETTTVTEVDVS